CSAGAQCLDNVCVCEPQCVGKECGPDGCGGLCGECTDGGVCDDVKGLCECSPVCDGKQCGPDGCGSECGQCLDGLTCDVVSGSCFCEPDCAGKFCGPDGCGGLCGECAVGDAACVDGSCVEYECGDGICTEGENCVLCGMDCPSQDNCFINAFSSCGCGGLGTKKCGAGCDWLPCMEPECCPGEPDSCGACQVCVGGTCQDTFQCAQGDQEPCGKCGVRTCLLDGSCSWGPCTHQETQQVLPDEHCCDDTDCSPCQQCDTETWACVDREKVCDTPGEVLGSCGEFGCGVETCGADCTTTSCADPECCVTEDCVDQACNEKACLGGKCFYFPINECTPED
ncbi:MAG: hypothetical protein VX938_02645, partial [Myxococcota bacterium]|nr:hypothetical protein [Myxococcota bacterium]